MKVSQRDAVHSATHAILKQAGVSFEDGNDVSTYIDKPMREKVIFLVCEMFRTGKAEFENTPSNAEKLASPAKLKQYVGGLVSNWYRKDPRFNGNTKYVAKNPGSRAGAGDEQLKALKLLAVKFKGTDKEAIITKQIAVRQETINAERAKAITADLSVLDPDFLASLGIDQE